MTYPFIIQLDLIQSVDSIFLLKTKYDKIIEDYLKCDEFNLYSISKSKKVRFNQENCVVIGDNLSCEIYIGGSLLELSVPKQNILNIKNESSTSRCLTCETLLGEIKMTISSFLTNYKIDHKFKHEILYIGRSKDIEKRFINHEKIIMSYASLEDDEELLLNFIKPSFAYFNISKKELIQFNKGTILKTEFSTFDYEDLIKLSERLLVNFYCPEFNRDFIKLDLSKDEIFKRIKKIAKFNILVLETSIEGQYHNYFSPNQKIQDETVFFENNVFKKFNL